MKKQRKARTIRQVFGFIMGTVNTIPAIAGMGAVAMSLVIPPVAIFAIPAAIFGYIIYADYWRIFSNAYDIEKEERVWRNSFYYNIFGVAASFATPIFVGADFADAPPQFVAFVSFQVFGTIFSQIARRHVQNEMRKAKAEMPEPIFAEEISPEIHREPRNVSEVTEGQRVAYA